MFTIFVTPCKNVFPKLSNEVRILEVWSYFLVLKFGGCTKVLKGERVVRLAPKLRAKK